jgi:phosphohistidine phosphatase
MKTILFLRHGQADPGEELPDAERPLTAQGRREARRMGAVLRRLGLLPDLVLCSPALRARDTAALAAAQAGCAGAVQAEPRLYQAKAEDYLELLRGLPARAGRVLLVGHVPAVRQAAAALLGGAAGSLRMSPAALACIEVPAEKWSALEPGSGVLQWLLPPELPASFR